MTLRLAVVLALATMACNDGTEIDTDTSSDTDTDTSSDTDTDTEVITSVHMIRTAKDAFTGDVLTEATAIVDGEAVMANAESEFDFWLDIGEPAELVVSAAGYLDTIEVYYPRDTDGVRGNTYMLSRATVGAIGTAIGVSGDPAKSMVHVQLLDTTTTPFSWVPGAMVAIDASYAVALAGDSASPFGVSAGTTTLDGSRSSIYSVNVDPGAFELTVALPNGLTSCEYTPGGALLDTWSPTAVADSFVSVTVLCE